MCFFGRLFGYHSFLNVDDRLLANAFLILNSNSSDNNRASTVLEAFTGAVERHGLPSQVRSDLGGENVDVWRYMMEQHQSKSAVITGHQLTMKRVERLWRDITRSVGSFFYDTFRCLEDNGQLNPLNEVDIYCLH